MWSAPQNILKCFRELAMKEMDMCPVVFKEGQTRRSPQKKKHNLCQTSCCYLCVTQHDRQRDEEAVYWGVTGVRRRRFHGSCLAVVRAVPPTGQVVNSREYV